ncbi:hypothetical protein FJZ31_10485 [Candidatus Poribacteria bacterium]|nr:hypothetical protein [Candidatus Poribacteria bacterium]
MDEKTAIAYLTDPGDRKTSEISKAIDVLYQKHQSYKAISQQVGVSPKFLRTRHNIFRLPQGIQWQIDQEHIGITQAYQISRLKKEDDQWLLAFTIVKEKLSIQECEDVVNIVLTQNRSLREALSTSAGCRFDKIQPLLLPIGFDIWFAINRAAWNQKEDWADLCYRLIRQGLNVNIREVVSQLRTLATDLEKAESMGDSAKKETDSSNYQNEGAVQVQEGPNEQSED